MFDRALRRFFTADPAAETPHISIFEARPDKRAAVAIGAVLAIICCCVIGPDAARSFADDAGIMSFWISEGARRQPAPRRDFVARAPEPSYHASARRPVFRVSRRLFGSVQHRAKTARHEHRWMPRTTRISEAASAVPNLSASGQHSVCVRLCDGYFFPVGNYSGPSDQSSHEAICEISCPDAPTRLFVQARGHDDIADATGADDGRPYSALPVAFRHEDKADKTCSCHRHPDMQARLMSSLKDFTLRRGDALMTPAGFRVFRGAAHYPFASNDFTALASAPHLEHRSALQAIEKASVRNGQKSGSESRPPADTNASFPDPASRQTVRVIGPARAYLVSTKTAVN